MTELHPPRSILRRSKQYLSLAGLTSSDGPDWTFATEKKLRYTLDLRQAPRQKQHTTALQVFDFLGFRKSAGMVAKEKLSQLDVTYCLTFILSESFNNSRNSLKQRPEVQPFRDHPFKTSTNFHKFLTPNPPYRRQFSSSKSVETSEKSTSLQWNSVEQLKSSSNIYYADLGKKNK